jgi:tetratricopeptide (TPR) repeat protein
MKSKSVFATFFIALLAVVVLIDISSPLWAETGSKNMTTAKQRTAVVKKDSDYWFDKGALCATYGNNKAAIKYFQKAIAKNPNRSDAYFSQGVSYGQLGDFIKAVNLIDKALELEPQKGLYYYGRGRVYLLAGEKKKAVADFRKAAELDDEDAQAYIDQIAGAR